ncbi:MAG: peptidase [Nocardioidaceae bacterium]|nr:peptidase [Nocardioidaceae bacterium]
MTDRVLVAGVGNIFLGDDGFGPQVAGRLLGERLPEQVRVVDYGIRGLHLAYDLLDGYQALVLVDALPGAGQPGEVVVLEVGEDDLGTGSLDAHGMDPVAVLASLDGLGGQLPRTVVVGCAPLDVGEGIGLTPLVQGAVEVAAGTVRGLVDDLLSPAAPPPVPPPVPQPVPQSAPQPVPGAATASTIRPEGA